MHLAEIDFAVRALCGVVVLDALGGNLVHIENGCLLNRVLIEISGHGNKLIIHRGARFLEGGRIRIEDSCNTVEIGENCHLLIAFYPLRTKIQL